jgi:hypothetical protein
MGSVGDDCHAIRHRSLRRQSPGSIGGTGWSGGAITWITCSTTFFLCSVIIGYAFILPERSRLQVLILLAICSGYEVSTFLAFSTTERFKISYLKFGPTEFRLALIVINALLVKYGTRNMINGLKYVNVGGRSARS